MSNPESNRANAQFSTGPRTPEGKHRSSLNALRHGLTGQLIVMPTEDLEAYRRHLASFADDFRPKGAMESNLVQSLADTAWRLHRIAALEASLKAAHGALELARPVLDDILQSLCESYCPPCEVGDKYDYSELQEPELGWITRTEAALDAVEAAISPPEQLMKEEA